MTITLNSSEWTQEYKQLVKDTYCKGASDMEAKLFLNACQRTGLEPGKQIYAVKRWDSGLKREVMSVQTGIDGYRLIAERTGCYAPGREPTYSYDKDTKLVSATAYVKKLTKDGTWHEVSATAFYEEYVQKTKEGLPTKFWKQMPHGQLAKCAEALALRRAFPSELSGLYTQDEMAQASTETKEVTAEECKAFLDSFGGEKDLFCQYVEKLSVDYEWTMAETMKNCLDSPDKVKRTFEVWKAKQRPLEIIQEAQGE